VKRFQAAGYVLHRGGPIKDTCWGRTRQNWCILLHHCHKTEQNCLHLCVQKTAVFIRTLIGSSEAKWNFVNWHCRGIHAGGNGAHSCYV